MSSHNRQHKIREIILDHLILADNTDMTRKTNLQEDLGADSLDILEICMSIEGGFAIKLKDHQHEKIKTFGDLLEMLNQTLGPEK